MTNKRGSMDSDFQSKTTEVKVMERRHRVTELVLQGWSYSKIGKDVGVSAVQVCRDMKECVEEWRESYLQDIDTIKAREVKRIEHLLSNLWDEFEVSKYRTIAAKTDPKTGKPVKGTAGKDQKVRVVGSMDVIDRIQVCIAQLWKLYGIGQDAAPTNNTLNVFNVDKLTETLKAVAVEQENSRLAEVERIAKDQAQIASMTPSEDMSPLEKLEAMRKRDQFEKNGANGHTESEG